MPHTLKSPCLPPGAVFGYFPALDLAKPDPAFLHSQLLKAGNKAGIAPFCVGWQGISRGCSLSTVCQASGQGIKGPVEAACAECFPACSAVIVPAKMSQCLPACSQLPVTASVTATGHPLLVTYSLTFMEVSVICLKCGLGQSLPCLENKKPTKLFEHLWENLSRTRDGEGNYAIPKLYCKHTLSCSYLYHIPMNAWDKILSHTGNLEHPDL